MAQSLSALHVHLVFSTKERRPFLQDVELRARLHAYLGGISATLDCSPVRAGGMADHVHILALLGRSITQAEWVKELKRASNLWLKERGREFATFQWQGGYAAFSVSKSNVAQVVEYIERQEEHHRRFTFQDELRLMFRRHEVEFDERYVWD